MDIVPRKQMMWSESTYGRRTAIDRNACGQKSNGNTFEVWDTEYAGYLNDSIKEYDYNQYEQITELEFANKTKYKLENNGCESNVVSRSNLNLNVRRAACVDLSHIQILI
jgi:hypothetical protein